MDPEEIRRYVGAVYKAHSRSVVAYARRRLGQYSQFAEDVVQDASIRLQRRLQSAHEAPVENDFFAILFYHHQPEGYEAGIMFRHIAKYAAMDMIRRLRGNEAEESWDGRGEDQDADGGKLLTALLTKDDHDDASGHMVSIMKQTAEVHLMMKQAVEELIRETPAPLERAALIGRLLGTEDNEIAGRFNVERIDVQHARSRVRARARRIFAHLLRD